MTNNKRDWEDELLTLQRKQGLEIEDRGEETEWGAVQIHEETKAFIKNVEDTARKEVLISLQNEVENEIKSLLYTDDIELAREIFMNFPPEQKFTCKSLFFTLSLIEKYKQ